jgi:DNA-binding transcriptional LysR family regulator
MVFVIKDVIASRVMAHVRAEEVDLGVVGGEIVEPDFEVIHATRDEMHVVFPASHPIGKARKITLDVLASYPLVLMDPETSVRKVVDAAFVAAGRLPNPACEATYMATAVGMVRAGLGVTVLPASAMELRAEKGLRSRRISDPLFTRPIAVIKKAGRSLPPASADFVKALVSALR